VTVLDLSGLAAWITEHHRRDLLRAETLDRYRAASDGDELDRYLRGEPEPDRAAKAAWLDRIRLDTADGRAWRRLRIVRTPLTDYVRYSCEWGYTDNSAAGEEVPVLDLSSAPPGADVLARIGDFYLLERKHVAAMTYDGAGTFSHADVLDAPVPTVHQAAAAAGWQLAEPFTDWWSRHPEHRSVSVKMQR
jgi:hypothetical protein